MPLTEAVTYSWGVSQCMTPEDDPSIPEGTCRIITQGEFGQCTMTVLDPDRVAELLADWVPYKAGVDAAVADLTGQTPWPDAPMFTLSLMSA